MKKILANDPKLAEALEKKRDEPSLLRSLMNPSYREYLKIVKDFAILLVYYSTRAYEFVRKATDNALPHINSVRNWQRVYDTSPGFNKSIIPATRAKIQEAAARGTKLKFSLQLDGMYINSTIERDQNGNTYGFVDTGNTEPNQSTEPKKKNSQGSVGFLSEYRQRPLEGSCGVLFYK